MPMGGGTIASPRKRRVKPSSTAASPSRSSPTRDRSSLSFKTRRLGTAPPGRPPSYSELLTCSTVLHRLPHLSAKRQPQTAPGLRRELGLLDSTLLMVGVIIGSGIFLTTGIMAEALPSRGWLLAAWAAGGLLTLAGALAYAELGAAMPEAGGQYVYLREAYGPLLAFLFGWISLLVYQPGAISAVAVGFAAYLGAFVPALGTEAVVWRAGAYTLSAGQLVAAAAILGLTALNARGLRLGAIVQNVSTLLKCAAIVGFIVFGLV